MAFYVRSRQTPMKLLVFRGVSRHDVQAWLATNGEKGEIVERDGQIHLYITKARAEIVASKLLKNPLETTT